MERGQGNGANVCWLPPDCYELEFALHAEFDLIQTTTLKGIILNPIL